MSYLGDKLLNPVIKSLPFGHSYVYGWYTMVGTNKTYYKYMYSTVLKPVNDVRSELTSHPILHQVFPAINN